MKRGKPLKRRTWMRRKRAQRRGDPNPPALAFPKPAGRAYDDDYRAAVLEECCLLADVPGHVCDSRTTGDHGGKRPLGRKSDDREELPFCWGAHQERQTATGWCKGVNAPAMRMILTTAIAETQARVLVRLGRAA